MQNSSELIGYELASQALRAGKRIRRSHWPAGDFLYLTQGRVITYLEWKGPKDFCKMLGEEDGNVLGVRIGTHIDRYHTDGCIEVGWHPTNIDLLMKDWVVL